MKSAVGPSLETQCHRHVGFLLSTPLSGQSPNPATHKRVSPVSPPDRVTSDSHIAALSPYLMTSNPCQASRVDQFLSSGIAV